LVIVYYEKKLAVKLALDKYQSNHEYALADKLALNVYMCTCDWRIILESWKCHFFIIRTRVSGLIAPILLGLVAIENSYRHHIIKVSLDFLLRSSFPRYFIIGNLTTPKLQISFLGSTTTAVSYHVANHPFYVLGVATLPHHLISLQDLIILNRFTTKKGDQNRYRVSHDLFL